MSQGAEIEKIIQKSTQCKLDGGEAEVDVEV